jgi:hypothetical protein
MSDQESLKEVAKSRLSSLVTQTAQVGLGFGLMLVMTGGKPSPTAIGLTVIGSIAFVAATEERRLTKEYAQHKQLVEKHRLELEEKD